MLDNKKINKPIHQESKTLLGKISEIEYGKLGVAISGLTIFGCQFYPVATATIIGALPYIGIGMLGMVSGALIMDAFKSDVVEDSEELAKEANEGSNSELNRLNSILPVGATKKEGK